MNRFVIPVVAIAAVSMGFVPQDDVQFVTASYYASGKVTANGEAFDPMGMTAAHRRLKFGTLLHVENPENGLGIIVRINDRGPYIDGRSLDLSLGAAEKLGMIEKGIATVKVTVLD
jgi:rare lipoprotein A